MTDKATQDEREAFEKWGNTDASDEDVAERALLNDSPTQFHAWLAWQARATLQSTEPALPEPFGRTGKPDHKRAAEVLEAAGMTLDGLSTDAMRHVITKVWEMLKPFHPTESDSEKPEAADGDRAK